MRHPIPVPALACGHAGAATAQQGPRPLSAIIAGLEAQGRRVADVDVDRGVIDVEAVSAVRRRVDLRLNPAGREILARTRDDRAIHHPI